MKPYLDKQTFNFPIFNPEYIRVKDSFDPDIDINDKYWKNDFERYSAEDAANTTAEMSKLAINDIEDEKNNEAYLCGMTRYEYDKVVKVFNKVGKAMNDISK